MKVKFKYISDFYSFNGDFYDDLAFAIFGCGADECDNYFVDKYRYELQKVKNDFISKLCEYEFVNLYIDSYKEMNELEKFIKNSLIESSKNIFELHNGGIGWEKLDATNYENPLDVAKNEINKDFKGIIDKNFNEISDEIRRDIQMFLRGYDAAMSKKDENTDNK